ncbi:unnamed protein product [Lactuca saligna]|uniref:Uncharacterized protein n=1 Tax=Lactuca saligna TaxID=75948 RepID=A0AA36E6C2_LACSI|nr:unnamed protein product [Lactuca saligna]
MDCLRQHRSPSTPTKHLREWSTAAPLPFVNHQQQLQRQSPRERDGVGKMKEIDVGSEDGEFYEKGDADMQNESLFCGFTERRHHKSMVSPVVMEEPVEEADTIGDKELVAVVMEKVEMAKAVDELDDVRTVTHNAKVSQQMSSSVGIPSGFDTNSHSIGVVK